MTWETSDFKNLKLTDIIFSHIHNSKKILNFYDEHEFLTAYTIKEIYEEVQKKKKILSSSLQVDELVFLSWDFNFEFVTLFLALLEIDVIPVPLLADKDFISDRYLFYLLECKSKTGISKIIAPEKYKESLVTNGFEIVILKKEKDFFNSRNNPQIPKLIKHLGIQKNAFVRFGLSEYGIDSEALVFSHQNILKSILKLKTELLLGEEQKIMSALHMKEEYFLFANFLVPLVVGIELHYYSFRNTKPITSEWLKKSSNLQAEIWIGNCEFYKDLLLNKDEKLDSDITLMSLRHCLCSSRNLDPDLADHINYEFKKINLSDEAFKIFYSPAVNHFITGFTRKKITIEKLNNKKLPSIGTPIKGNFYRITDENNYVLGEDQEGFICVKSNTFVPAVYNFETKSEQLLDEQTWYRTNDIGFISKGELFRTGWDSPQVIFQKSIWTKSALKEKVQKIFGAISEVKGIQIQSLIGKKGEEEIYIIVIMGFSLKWFGPFLKRKLTNKLVEKLKITKEQILFIPDKKLPLTLDGRMKPLTFKRQIAEYVKSNGEDN